MSINRWVDKEAVVHLYTGILLGHKKAWNNAIDSNMDEPRDHHTKWTKSERQIPHDIIHMQNPKYDINEPIYKAETDSQT